MPFESTANSTSHNAGKNCLNCHSSGEKLMTFGGTVYTGIASSTTAGGQNIDVIVRKNGAVKFRIPVDKSGNFYTDRDVSFPFNVALSNGSAMVSSVNNGGCNKSGCHVAGNRIF